jgi:dolichol kinase
MLISDTLAALIGKACGQRKIYKNKSLEGTCAFFVSALIIMILFNPIYTFTYASVIACFFAVFMELYEDWFELDDNFSIPLVIGFILTIFAQIT